MELVLKNGMKFKDMEAIECVKSLTTAQRAEHGLYMVEDDMAGIIACMRKRGWMKKKAALEEVQALIAKEAKDTVWLTETETMHDAIERIKGAHP
jgi:hypothetical protein